MIKLLVMRISSKFCRNGIQTATNSPINQAELSAAASPVRGTVVGKLFFPSFLVRIDRVRWEQILTIFLKITEYARILFPLASTAADS